MPTHDAALPAHLAAMLGALLLVPPLVLALGLLRERSLGRLDPLRPDRITRAWLEANVLGTRPEVIGAMWDEHVGSDEVIAMLARLVQEQKLRTTLAGAELQLELLVPRLELAAHERSLVDGLFFRGDRSSTGEIRSHYKSAGFDPARLIEKEALTLAEQRLPKGEPARPSGAPQTLTFLAAAAAMAYAVLRQRDMLTPVLACFGAGFVATIFASIGPNAWRSRKDAGVPLALLSMLPAAIGVGLAGYVLWRSEMLGSPKLSFEVQLGITLLALWAFSTAVWTLLTRESRESFALRRMLTAAREFFRAELGKPQPALDDSWYPYLLAFGLRSELEKWSREFAAAAWSRGASASHSPRWTGGGESFGGALSPGAWASAAAGVAIVIAPPLKNTTD